jgi:hypothetical protein
MATQTAYQKKLLDPRWQKKRLKILERDDWTCTVCGRIDRTLHVHHEEYFGDPWDISDNKLSTVCCVCHEEKHLPNETKKVVNIKANKKISKHAFLSELLNIRSFSDYNQNPKALPQHIKNMWNSREKVYHMTDEYFTYIYWGIDNQIKMDREHYLAESYDKINNECFDWNLVLIDDSEEFTISYLGMSKIDIKNKDYSLSDF